MKLSQLNANLRARIEAQISAEDAALSDRAGVPFFHKQMPIGQRVSGDMAEWPQDLQVREFYK